MAGKLKEPTYTFIITTDVTLRIRRMADVTERDRLGVKRYETPPTESQWEYSIHVKGKKMALFAGTNLYTNSTDSIFEAAYEALWLHMPTVDSAIPDYFDAELMNTPQFRWFLDTARKLRGEMEGLSMIGEIPGVYMKSEGGVEVHFDVHGWPVEPVALGSVSEGTRQLIDAPMDIVDPENESPVIYPNLNASPFSG